MKNDEVIHMIENAVKVKLNNRNVKLEVVDLSDGHYSLRILELFGYSDINFILEKFKPIDIVSYFDNKIVNRILDKLLYHKKAIKHSKNRSYLTAWMPVELEDGVVGEIKEIIPNFDHVGDLFNRMGRANYLNKPFVNLLIKDYCESIASCYISTPVKKINYMIKADYTSLLVVFHNDMVLEVVTDAFDNVSNFFNDVSREIATENLLLDIRADMRSLICKQKNI